MLPGGIYRVVVCCTCDELDAPAAEALAQVAGHQPGGEAAPLPP